MKEVTVKLDCYQDIADMMRGSLVKSGRNENDEIVFCEYKVQTPEEAAHYEIRTYQKNGRTRVNGFYPDGTTTETFEDYEQPSEE
jgi:hypothetical protein